MTFTGANAKIHEIMLLEFGIEIDANADFTQINPDFVDRSGVVHPDAGDGIAYTSVRSGTNAISGKLIMWSRWFLGKRFWKRRRIFCIGGLITATMYMRRSRRGFRGGFSRQSF